MKLKDLLTEATKDMNHGNETINKVWLWMNKKTTILPQWKTDSRTMNGMVSTLAKVLRKSIKGGKYILTTKDFDQLEKLNFTTDNLSPTLFKKLTGLSGGGKEFTGVIKSTETEIEIIISRENKAKTRTSTDSTDIISFGGTEVFRIYNGFNAQSKPFVTPDKTSEEKIFTFLKSDARHRGVELKSSDKVDNAIKELLKTIVSNQIAPFVTSDIYDGIVLTFDFTKFKLYHFIVK